MWDEAGDISDLALSYGAGRMPAPMRLLIDTRARLETDTRNAAKAADALGGALLETIDPVALRPDALKDMLNLIDALDEDDAAHADAAAEAGKGLDEILSLPEPARGAALAALEQTGWKFAGPGLRTLPLMSEGETKAELIRIEPGKGAPNHGHSGEEYTLVLTGAFGDGRRVYEPGDLCVAGPDVVHRPVAEPGRTCIALAVTDAPLAYRGALGLMQRVFRLN